MHTQSLPKISLYCSKDGADKEYHVEVVEVEGGFSLAKRSGKRGAAKLQKGAAPVLTLAAATAEFDSVVKEKTGPRKGYTECASGLGYATDALAGSMSGNRPHLPTAMDEVRCQQLVQDERWGMQWKICGEHLMVERTGARITTSNKLGVINTVPQCIVDAVAALDVDDIVLDGELLDGKMYVFDVLRLDGRSLTSMGAGNRCAIYQALDFPDALVKVAMEIGTKAKVALLKRVAAAKAEGIVAKLLGAPYEPGKAAPTAATQFKYKLIDDSSCIVTGVHATKRSVSLGLLMPDGSLYDAGCVAVPTNAAMPSEGDIIDVRYRHLYAGGGAFCEPVFLKQRTDVTRNDCTFDQVLRIVDTAAGDGAYTPA